MSNIIHTRAFLFILFLRFASTLANDQHAYIVYTRKHGRDKTTTEIEDLHLSHIESVKKGSREQAKASLLYSYKKVINGFSAMLSPEEATQLSSMEGVASVIRTDPRGYELHTSRSWEFVSTLDQDSPGGGGQSNGGLNEKLLRKANYGQDLIVGVLDTGIWPESASFKDGGMEPVPSTWKGICQTGTYFKNSHCNRKIIGAQYFIKDYEKQYGTLNATVDYRSPRDKSGHGTHTASTIGGRRVHNVSAIGGFARGTASCGVPLVRLAIYKVCWQLPGGGSTCMTADILAAIEAAINDGVHVMSMSLGSTPADPYNIDGVAAGALGALHENIVSICSAGNSGPTPSLIGNVAPWILTVAASSLDRDFPAFLLLGNGQKIQGQSVTSFQTPQTHPLVFGSDVEIKGTTNVNTTGYCKEGTLLPSAVKGKIVLCIGEFPGNDWEVKQAGGAGVIQVIALPNVTETTYSPLLLPGIVISLADAIQVVSYARTHKNPTVTLFPGKTTLGGSSTNPAPQMAWFSSRGPNNLDPNILKPDVTAPGLNILAAWSQGTSPTPLAADHRVAKYNIISGTSMSCPHVSAAVLLLKAIHPDWSSAAIRSALMTTAGTKNNKGTLIKDEVGNEATPFDYGSGHIRPYKAVDPGLVYNATLEDYGLFLCNGGYDLGVVLDKCPEKTPSPSDLNYPSLAIANLKGKRTVLRTVTNVGKAGKSVYNVTVLAPTGYSVRIAPEKLYFGKVGEKKNFTVSVKKNNIDKKEKGKYAFGWYEWKDGIHSVRSPIVVSST